MRSTTYFLVAIFLYTIIAVLTEKKLASMSAPFIVASTHAVVLVIMLPLIKFGGNLGLKLVPPKNSQYLFLAICGVIMFFADYLSYTGYNAGASAVKATTLVMLMPVFAAIINLVIGSEPPTKNQMLSWFFAALAVVFATKRT